MADGIQKVVSERDRDSPSFSSILKLEINSVGQLGLWFFDANRAGYSCTSILGTRNLFKGPLLLLLLLFSGASVSPFTDFHYFSPHFSSKKNGFFWGTHTHLQKGGREWGWKNSPDRKWGRR